MLSAFRSRDAVLRQIEKLERYHRATEDGCICGKGNCETLNVIDADWINDRIAMMHKLNETADDPRFRLPRPDRARAAPWATCAPSGPT